MNKPAELKLASVPVWINGKPLAPAGRMGEVFNPATGQVARQVPYCDATIVDAAVKAAAAALPEWRGWPPLRRARVMQEFLNLLRKNQKPWLQSSLKSMARRSLTRRARSSAAWKWSSSPAAFRSC